MLIPVGKNFFRSEKDPEATAVFATDSAGKMVFSSQEMEGFSYGERTSIIWTYARLALLVLCAALMATSLLFAIVWVLRKVFGGMKDVQHLAVRADSVARNSVLLCVGSLLHKAELRTPENSLFGMQRFLS